MADRLREATGTVATALAWAGVTFVFFVGLGFATHVIVEMTVKSGSAAWRAALGAVAAMFLVSAIVALLLITGRGVSLLPSRLRARRLKMPER